jgi:enoyl-CoA hydratase
VTERRHGDVSVVTLDDGRANVLTVDVIAGLGAALDRAEAEEVGVVLAGRPDRFCAGFDLRVLGSSIGEAATLSRAGFELAHRMLSFPHPLVVACTGHAYAMGSFLLLAGDLRLGVRGGDHRITANEVAVGITMPRAAIALCRRRIAPSHLDRVVALSEAFAPDEAVDAGFLDATVDGDALLDEAVRRATALMALDTPALAGTKARLREADLAALAAAIEADDADLLALA